MNKMMIAAALALTMGAVVKADTCGDPDPIEPGPCALWYDVAISVKTTGAKSKKVKVECDDPEKVCYRVTSSKSFKGIYASCGCECDDFKGAVLYLWNTKEKLIYAFGEPVTWSKLWRIGKPSSKDGAGTDVEADLTFDGGAFSFWAQGFGKFDVSKGHVQKINGSLVGNLFAPMCAVSCDDDIPALVWDCDGVADDAAENTVAFGTWSMKYNKTKSAKLANSNVVVLPVSFKNFAPGVSGGEE